MVNDMDAAASVEELTVQPRVPFLFEALLQPLVVTTFLTDLILILPFDPALDALDTLQFPYLELFKTNISHRGLPQFLALHVSLTDLCLDSCGRGADAVCPLAPVDLRHVTTIECPLSCISGIAHPKLLRLTCERKGHLRPSSPTIPAVLRKLRTPLVSLFALTVDIFPDDYDILESIIPCAQRIERLKLLERPRTYMSLYSSVVGADI